MQSVPDAAVNAESTGDSRLNVSSKSPSTSDVLPFLSQNFLAKFSDSLNLILSRKSLFLNNFNLEVQFKAFLFKYGSDEQMFPKNIFANWVNQFIRESSFENEELARLDYDTKKLRFKDQQSSPADYRTSDVHDPRDLTLNTSNILDQNFEALSTQQRHFLIGLLNHFGDYRIRELGLDSIVQRVSGGV